MADKTWDPKVVLSRWFHEGAIVTSTFGTDRVIEGWGQNPRGYGVTVVACDAEGNALPGHPPREHSTVPSEKSVLIKSNRVDIASGIGVDHPDVLFNPDRDAPGDRVTATMGTLKRFKNGFGEVGLETAIEGSRFLYLRTNDAALLDTLAAFKEGETIQIEGYAPNAMFPANVVPTKILTTPERFADQTATYALGMEGNTAHGVFWKITESKDMSIHMLDTGTEVTAPVLLVVSYFDGKAKAGAHIGSAVMDVHGNKQKLADEFGALLPPAAAFVAGAEKQAAQTPASAGEKPKQDSAKMQIRFVDLQEWHTITGGARGVLRDGKETVPFVAFGKPGQQFSDFKPDARLKIGCVDDPKLAGAVKVLFAQEVQRKFPLKKQVQAE